MVVGVVAATADSTEGDGVATFVTRILMAFVSVGRRVWNHILENERTDEKG